MTHIVQILLKINSIDKKKKRSIDKNIIATTNEYVLKPSRASVVPENLRKCFSLRRLLAVSGSSKLSNNLSTFFNFFSFNN